VTANQGVPGTLAGGSKLVRGLPLVAVLLWGALPSGAFGQAPAQPSQATPPSGRYQLVVVPGHSGSPFLVDTTTGCVWHLIQNPESKRSTFIEMDVENLHWSWGSGAQQLLASRIDASPLPEEQKRALKQDLQKTGCGLANVVLTPGPSPAAGASPAPAPSQPPRPRR